MCFLTVGAGRKRGPTGSQGMTAGRSDVGISMQQGPQPKSNGTLSYQHGTSSNHVPNLLFLCCTKKKRKVNLVVYFGLDGA